MDEKIIIKSEQYDFKKVFKMMVIVGVVLSAIGFLISVGYYFDFDYCFSYVTDATDIWLVKREIDWAIEDVFEDELAFLILIPVASLALIGGLIYLWLRSYELTVTDKRIYGKVAGGKRVDLPINSISATAISRTFKGVSVSTSSGRITFLFIKNAEEMYEKINSILIERQNKEAATIVTAENKTDTSDNLIKLKELLDKGIITQEEFDAKKKQILGL